MVFLISFITTTILTNRLNRQREKKRVTSMTVTQEILVFVIILSFNKLSRLSSYLLLEHVTYDKTDLLKA